MARGDVTMLICYPTGGDNVGAKLKNIVGRFSSEISTVSRISIRDKYRGNRYGGERSKVSRFVNASSAFVRKFRFVNKLNGEYPRSDRSLFHFFAQISRWEKSLVCRIKGNFIVDNYRLTLIIAAHSTAFVTRSIQYYYYLGYVLACSND